MSTLIAIAYPDEHIAKQARTALAGLQREHLVELDDAVIAVNDGEKIRLEQAINLTTGGALGGAMWGGLIGLIFLMPVAGMAIGAASGALAGKFTDYGIEDTFVKEIGRELTPGKAALIVLARRATPDKVIEEMKQFGGTVIRTNLSNEAEQKLQAALTGQTPDQDASGAVAL
jgi:uncharacterized membrane protein